MAAEDWDGYEEELAGQAYLRVFAWKAAALLAAAVAGIGLVAADYAFGIMALFVVPRLASDFLAGWIAAEMAFGFTDWRQHRKDIRAQDAGKTEGERREANLDRMRAADETPPWWRAGLRRPKFWMAAVVRAVYSSCAGLVIAAHFGVPAGLGAAALLTAYAVAARSGLGRAVRGWSEAVLFADPRQPRDSPEM